MHHVQRRLVVAVPRWTLRDARKASLSGGLGWLLKLDEHQCSVGRRVCHQHE